MFPSLDLTLPLKVLTERYRKERHDISPRAIYSLVDLREGGADELLKVIEADDGNLRDTCRVAPEYDFAGQSLKAVYGYYLELGTESRLQEGWCFIGQPRHGSWVLC